MNERMIDQLRERLCILWGNLQELQYLAMDTSKGTSTVETDAVGRDYWKGALSNLPFECCIREYGQRVEDEQDEQDEQATDNWVRCYELFGTTIM